MLTRDIVYTYSSVPLTYLEADCGVEGLNLRLIECNGLKVHFDSPDGMVKAVDNIDFHIDEGEKLVFIGETGSGKTVLGMTVMKLLPRNVYYSGRLTYKERDLLSASEREMESIRGRDIAIMMQNPLSALNPCLSAREHLTHVYMRHKRMPRKDALCEAARTLVRTGVPESHVDCFPHQLSGGLRQRVMIALGVACDADLLIADEPTKGLDVTVQMQIVKLLRRLTDGTSKSMFVITHDLGVAAALADRIAIMYCGRILETGKVREIFENPGHPYTKGLIASHPCNEFSPIAGFSSSLVNLPAGCVFRPRCRITDRRCAEGDPIGQSLSKTHKVWCRHALCA
jgi:peptide/nickel transport system ATP-binding protein